MKTQLYHYFIILITSLLLIAIVTSCNDSHIAAIDQGEIDAATIGSVSSLSNQEKGKLSPQEAYDAFFDMVEKVQSMQREEIENLSDREIIDLGQPILDATAGTTTLPPETLEKLNSPLQALADNLQSINKEQHRQAGREVAQIIASDGSRTDRVFDSDDLRRILLNINGGTATMSATCEDLFDQWGGYVHLYPGDNMNLANSLCPAGSMFWVHGGTYNNQRVFDSKSGNFWLGVNGTVILDGLNSSPEAFTGGMANNYISWMEIQNYTDWGIISQSSQSTNITINNMTFRYIAGNKYGGYDEQTQGDDYGAILFDNAENVLVQNSFFNNVAHSVRFRFSDGPLQVLNNEAHNTGFGFFQCNDCKGKGENIRINNNSLEHTAKYGLSDLFDFINIYDSEGTSSNYIQVNNNRARVNLNGNNASGVSQFGCAIVLGDEGGKYQEAVGNIGVNPGGCGIGLAAGEHLYIADNKMFSQAVQPGISNVAYYSANYSEGGNQPCKYHHFVSQSNSADWECVNPEGECDPQNPVKNLAHASPNQHPCTDENDYPFDSNLNGLIKDEWGSMGAGIWNDW